MPSGAPSCHTSSMKPRGSLESLEPFVGAFHPALPGSSPPRSVHRTPSTPGEQPEGRGWVSERESWAEASSLFYLNRPAQFDSLWSMYIETQSGHFPPLYIFILKIKIYRASGQVLSWLKCHPNTPGLWVRPPGQGAYKNQPMNAWMVEQQIDISVFFFF